ncbi:gamete antigen 27/25 [Plasmodium sp. gorilla clade G1]|nr:gamete antigen 27/25 [Plasmodium sp. gorilla clade G1]
MSKVQKDSAKPLDKFGNIYDYHYEHETHAPLSPRIRKIGDIEFHACSDYIYLLMTLSKDPEKFNYALKDRVSIRRYVRKNQNRYNYFLIEEHVQDNIVNRISDRLISYCTDKEVTEDYIKKVDDYLWVEQRVIEEVSINVDHAREVKEKKRIMNDKKLIRMLFDTYEYVKDVKFTDDQYKDAAARISQFLIDVVDSYIIKPIPALPVTPDEPHHNNI